VEQKKATRRFFFFFFHTGHAQQEAFNREYQKFARISSFHVFDGLGFFGLFSQKRFLSLSFIKLFLYLPFFLENSLSKQKKRQR